MTAAAIDRAALPNKYMITVQIAKPGALAVATMGGSALERPSWLVSSTGDTVFEAIRSLASQSSRRLFWAHSNWLILGEELAREGIEDALDFFARDGEARRSAKLSVVKDSKGSDFLQTELEIDKLSAQAYAGILRNGTGALSTMVDIDLHRFIKVLSSEGIEPVAIRAEIIDRLPDVDIRGHTQQLYVSTAPRITGAAVFKGTRLVGWLDREETRGFNWIMGKVQSGIIVIERPDVKGKYMSIEITNAKSEMKVELVEGKPQVALKVRVRANIGDIQAMLDFDGTEAVVDSIQRRMARVIAHEIDVVIKKAQHEYASDIFGFGRAIYRRYPKKWWDLREDWNDRGFKDLKVNVEVIAKIHHIGLDEIGIRTGR